MAGTAPPGRVRPFRFASHAGAAGVLDQALVSGVNFLTIVLLARALAPADFGWFVLVFTALQTAGTLQAALVTRPHNVLAATRHGQAYADYSTTTVAAQGALTAAFAMVAAATAGLLYAAGSAQAVLVLASIPALVAWQLQELGRRMLYTESRLQAALANDLVAYGGQALALLALIRLGQLTGATAFLSLAAAFAAGALILAWQLRPALSGRLDRASLSGAWRFGKWLGVAEVGQWLSTHSYVYVAAVVVGPVASAALKAGQTLLGPVSVFLTFVTSYGPVLLARELAASGAIGRLARLMLVAVVAVVLPYCALVALFAEPLLEGVYGSAYGSYADVAQLFALYYVLLSVSTVLVATLSALRMTRDVFLGHAAGAVLSVGVGWLLLRELGPAGGVVGMIASWLVATAVFVWALRRPPAGTEVALEPPPPSAPAPAADGA